MKNTTPIQLSTKGLISRKKVLGIASKLWKASICKNASYEFVKSLYGDTYPWGKLALLAIKVYNCTTWGEAQKIAWKIAKHSLNLQLSLVQRILTDDEFIRAGGKVYSERVKGWRATYPYAKCPTEEVVYTTVFGRVTLTPIMKKFIAVS